MAADEPLTTAARLAAGVARAPLTFDSGCRRRLTNCIDAANQAQLRSR